MSLDLAAERCISVLVDLIKGRVSYVVQEAVVVVRDIFRKYPNKCARSGTTCSCQIGFEGPQGYPRGYAMLLTVPSGI